MKGGRIMLPMISRFSDQNWFPTLFNSFFDDDFWMTNRKNGLVTAPAVNIIDGEKEYKVEVAAPGMNKEDFCIHLDEGGNMVIAVEKKCGNTCDKDGNKAEAKCEKKYLHREFHYSKFQQAFTLPEDVDKDKITASMTDGILTVNLPKKEIVPQVETKRQIAIQ